MTVVTLPPVDCKFQTCETRVLEVCGPRLAGAESGQLSPEEARMRLHGVLDFDNKHQVIFVFVFIFGFSKTRGSFFFFFLKINKYYKLQVCALGMLSKFLDQRQTTMRMDDDEPHDVLPPILSIKPLSMFALFFVFFWCCKFGSKQIGRSDLVFLCPNTFRCV